MGSRLQEHGQRHVHDFRYPVVSLKSTGPLQGLKVYVRKSSQDQSLTL